MAAGYMCWVVGRAPEGGVGVVESVGRRLEE